MSNIFLQENVIDISSSLPVLRIRVQGLSELARNKVSLLSENLIYYFFCSLLPVKQS